MTLQRVFAICGLCLLVSSAGLAEPGWETVQTEGEPVARHEAAFVEYRDEFYLLGGRGIRPVSIYSPEKNTWRNASKPPIEFHHFQPVVIGDRILIVCAMTGPYPNETPLEQILVYEPGSDSWSWGGEIPVGRRRGAAGVTLVDGVVYVVGGIVNGHIGGYVNWCDRYDPSTDQWTELSDAPHKRDHFQCAHLNGRIYAAGGRTTSKETGQVFDLVVPEVDVFGMSAGTWESLPENLPTPRAGSFTAAIGNDIVVAGGESKAQKQAHAEVEAWDTVAKRWHHYPPLNRGRHGTSLILHKNYIYTCSGSGNMGGSPELTSLERLPVPNP